MADFPVKGEKITVVVGDESIEAKVTGVQDQDWFQRGVRHDFCDRHPEFIDALMRLTADEFEEVRVLAAYLAHP